MYKQSPPTFNAPASSVIRTTDGACIPFDPDNTDYQAYLAWLSAGNQPLSADADAEGNAPIGADTPQPEEPQ